MVLVLMCIAFGSWRKLKKNKLGKNLKKRLKEDAILGCLLQKIPLLQNLLDPLLRRRRRILIKMRIAVKLIYIFRICHYFDVFIYDVKSILPVKSITKAKHMRECLRSLKKNHKDEDASVKKAFQHFLPMQASGEESS